jgi:AcrR family transcriptional regulator
VARRAGVSTKTLYRLIPNKAALLKSMVSDRLDRLVSELNLRAADHTDIQEALCEALMVCADIALDAEVIALQRMVLQEPCLYRKLKHGHSSDEVRPGWRVN